MKVINNIKLFTEEEISKLFDVSQATIASWRRDGRIKSTRIGRAYYFPENAIEEYLRGETNLFPKIGKQVTK